ncbi:MFS transporter [Roseibacterium sp. SDUM158016]|uniref:MFS transporter n=1 Tax=Roseicyclus sediminis TaxID=2980997 RepID=UPI0021D2E6F2|nr:MFS transporter [Roseibacterium sp. SDUM158016]MCU4651751.1 MFS transporter [Roseibacterium sp. SDUM158016]
MASGPGPRGPEPENETTTKPGHLPGFCREGDRRFLLIAAILASALGFIDGTIIAIALPAIRAGLGASLGQALWINNAYLLPLSALILLGGALGDRFGVARAFGSGIAVFMAASLLCAVAPTAETMIAGRVLKGIGAALMIPGSLSLIARTYPRADRGRAIGVWAAASALTTALGPILGGLALGLGGPETWRLLFAINLPLGAVALWLLRRNVRHDPKGPPTPLDWPGAALITACLFSLAYGLTGPQGVTDPRPFSAAALFLAWFVWREARTAYPMVPLGLFSDRAFAAANLATFLVYFALTTVLFYLPMTLIAGWGTSEALASAVFAPLSVFIATLSATSGRLADRYGPGRLIGAGGALVALAFAGLALGIGTRNLWTGVLPATALMGLGMALVVAPLSTAIMTSLPEDRSGTASGINNAVSRVAGLIAVASMGSLAAALYSAAGGSGSFGAIADDPAHATAMTQAFAGLAWTTAALSAAGAAIGWLLIPSPPQSREISARR